MARTNQAEKQRNAQALREKENRIPVNNIIDKPVKTLEDLLAIYPAFTPDKSMNETIANYWKLFDFELLDKVVYFGSWCNYDCSGALMIFLAIDGSIQSISYDYSPFGSTDEDKELYIYEISAEYAKKDIDSLIAQQDLIENDDSSYGF